MADDKAKAVADAQKASQADTDAYYERIAASQPTPTQAENDRAKLGYDSVKELDDKEDDGSGSESDARIAAAKAQIAREESASRSEAKSDAKK